MIQSPRNRGGFYFMLMKNYLSILLICISQQLAAQNYPVFGPSRQVNIIGLSFDAMEPFISADGVTLFFNSLNDGINTSIHYASRIDDSTFVYIGPLKGVNQQTSPRLDAVPSIDQLNKFYWISTRNLSSQIETVHHGVLTGDSVVGAGRVYGNINIYLPGWIIMDAAITHSGTELYYSNAYFNNCSNGLPCNARLAIADRINDSTFSKKNASENLLQLVNDTTFLTYAPQLTHDGLELYFSRNPIGTTTTEVCVSTRNSTSDVFSAPMVLESSSTLAPEAATVTADKSRMYYHKKENGVYKLFMRRRTGTTAVKERITNKLSVYPSPADTRVTVENCLAGQELQVLDMKGRMIAQFIVSEREMVIDVSHYKNGMYMLKSQGTATTSFFMVQHE